MMHFKPSEYQVVNNQPINQSTNQQVTIISWPLPQSPYQAVSSTSTNQQQYGSWQVVQQTAAYQQPINQPINQSINQSINQPINHVKIISTSPPITSASPASLALLADAACRERLNQPINPSTNQLNAANSSINQSTNQLNATNSSIKYSIDLSTLAQQSLSRGCIIKALIEVLESLHHKQSVNQSINQCALPADVVDHCMQIGRDVIKRVFAVMQTSPTQRDLLVEEILSSIGQIKDCESTIWTEIREILQRAFQLHTQSQSLLKESSQSALFTSVFKANNQSINQPINQPTQPGLVAVPALQIHSPPQQVKESPPQLNKLRIVESPTTDCSMSVHSLPAVTFQSINQPINQSTIQPFNQPVKHEADRSSSPEGRVSSLTSITRCKFCDREWKLGPATDSESLMARNKQLKSKRDHIPYCKDNPSRQTNLAKRRAQQLKRTANHRKKTINESTNQSTSDLSASPHTHVRARSFHDSDGSSSCESAQMMLSRSNSSR